MLLPTVLRYGLQTVRKGMERLCIRDNGQYNIEGNSKELPSYFFERLLCGGTIMHAWYAMESFLIFRNIQ